MFGLSKEALPKAQVVGMLFNQQQKSVSEIIAILGISRATMDRYLEVVETVRN